ncbi:MAG: GNAT family N-acetyltransferase [Burkholderiales bacterium]|jgi:predicted GNAT family N-acyltransferase|uniref:GNAT family N-acetyltransferase n=1 Tax=Janthinobacterium tructae TaxID=2590869 RepID=A0A4Y6RAE6_9BURK|nr:GNAT family N-acetyltransferase [Janthinobacterium tructae]MBH1981783.1 GNAT family N-acetyltransferase [Burkholderiales bacterium]MBH1994559.1 GNAT family N-acetyltransferase [Burkholderiales bacterium]MBH2070635.1 GNAT family N-acetyltransferase [Burkholderiales bacterium]QDG69912.1 GNAT family N-acetyltransferase [Janthinobacterium tructae]
MTKHTIRLGDWATLGQDATAIRFEVFVDEQKVPAEIELDDMDAVCLHAVAYDEAGKAIGTGRLLPDGHIGRMAVRQPGRGTGVGGAILTLLMDKARARGDAAVVLNAQTVAAPFYARHGFVQAGDVFDEAGIAHVEMRLVFQGVVGLRA